jgi:hypothetical protein
MRFCFVASVVLSLAVLGCSSAPEVPKAPTPTATVKPRPRPSPATGPTRSPGPPLPTVSLSAPQGAADLSRQQTPCDRHEPGWKWVGTVVQDGRCVVGPCTCTKE